MSFNAFFSFSKKILLVYTFRREHTAQLKNGKENFNFEIKFYIPLLKFFGI